MSNMEIWIFDSPRVRRELEALLRSVPAQTRSIQVSRDFARATFSCASSTSFDLPSANLNAFRSWTRQRGWEAGHVLVRKPTGTVRYGLPA